MLLTALLLAAAPVHLPVNDAEQPAGLWFGSELYPAGDFDSDGMDDFVIWDAGNRYVTEPRPTTAWIVAGRLNGVLAKLEPAHPGLNLLSVAPLGDVDEDGAPDVVLLEGGEAGAFLRFVSGATWQPIFEVAAPENSYVLEPAGDLDGDGRSDVFVGAPGRGEFPGGVHALSGLNGTTIWNCAGEDGGFFFGGALSATVDFDGDRVLDVVVAAAGANACLSAAPSSGYVRVLSGVNGSELLRIDPETNDRCFGVGVLAVPDMNADGQPDVIVGVDSIDGWRMRNGVVVPDEHLRAYSGADGAKLWGQWSGESAHFNALALLPDRNGDGAPELLVGVPSRNFGGGVEVRAIQDGALLETIQGNEEGAWHLGADLAVIGDVDGDGLADWVSSDIAWGSRDRLGWVQVHSGQPGSALLRKLTLEDAQAWDPTY